MIYDIIYLLNQFVMPLPGTYEDFINEVTSHLLQTIQWHSLFPHVYDTKVLATTSEYFGRTDLGKIYEKCVNDNRLRQLLQISFDTHNGFSNYDGSDLLAHYHEAAYDAYMTGYAFAKIIKYKEYDFTNEETKKQFSGRKGKKPTEKKEEKTDEQVVQMMEAVSIDDDGKDSSKEENKQGTPSKS